MAGLLSDAQIAFYTTTIKRSLDQSLPLSRKSSTKTTDTSGHDTTPLASVGDIDCTVSKPTASQLQLYASVIGSQRAVMLRVMATDDVRQGDVVAYDGHDWTIHVVENAESYSWTNDYLAIVII
jgi:hypothetical protein